MQMQVCNWSDACINGFHNRTNHANPQKTSAFLDTSVFRISVVCRNSYTPESATQLALHPLLFPVLQR